MKLRTASLSRFTRLLFALCFLAAQTFGVVHAAQHEALAHGDTPGCEICAYANGAGAAPAALVFIPTPITRTPETALLKTVALPRRPFDRPNSRGPPSFLA